MELKVRDRVVCTVVYEGNTSTVGKHGTIIEEFISDNGSIYFSVQFDEKLIDGHSGNNEEGKSGYCWCIPSEHLIREATTKHDGSRLVFNFVVHG
jgi:hypothetical protein